MEQAKLTGKEETSPLALKTIAFADSVDTNEHDNLDFGGRSVATGADGLTEISGEGSRDEVQEVQNMTQKETRSVRIWRILVGLIILGAGAGVSIATFYYLDQQVADETEDKFYLFAGTIKDVSTMHFENMMAGCRSLSLGMTANANTEGETFPLVTMDNWEIHAGEARAQANIEAFIYFPYLSSENEIQAFNGYATQHQVAWQMESLVAYTTLNPQFSLNEFNTSFSPYVNTFNPETPWVRIPVTEAQNPVVPLYMMSPPPRGNIPIMSNFYAFLPGLFEAVITAKDFLIGNMDLSLVQYVDTLLGQQAHVDYHTALHGDKESGLISPSLQAHGAVMQPVFKSLGSKEIGGFIMGVVGFDSFLVDLLPNGIRGIRVLIENTCGNQFTYELDGNRATYMGPGDQRDPSHTHMTEEIFFDSIYQDLASANSTTGSCVYKYYVSPTSLYVEDNESNIPIIATVFVAAIFALMAIAFFIYDMFVTRRNNKMINTAARSNAIVSSIFPSTIRDRLLKDDDGENNSATGLLLPTKTHLKSFLSKDADGTEREDDGLVLNSKPLADLFLSTTVVFIDICGFTAWSSVREPSHVFTLLETVYRSFDVIARKRGVFKVETVGDCYVAVCGLPDPRQDHAIAMARFARDCLSKFVELSQRLEVLLGPDTAELGIRVGIHSGPVTAGVLRGERSRFQLFGDTMNTASRMESTCEKNRIQLSEETANLLKAAGKEHWCSPREGGVEAKGKGNLSTFWLNDYNDRKETMSKQESSATKIQEDPIVLLSRKKMRLIDWNVEVMMRLLKQIMRRRKVLGITPDQNQKEYESRIVKQLAVNANPLDEVREVIRLPIHHVEDSSVAGEEVSKEAAEELAGYIRSVAAMYRDNEFHNFEHASHVTMSVVKLLSRIVAPSEVDIEKSGKEGVSSLHDHTYGITSDPLTQFAVVLSALIHDTDHSGVPNAQLVKEGHVLASAYKNKSVAEQNSVDLAWSLLMEDRFTNLRACIYASENEMIRFRQLLVNVVLATDIADKELKILRNNRWETAFNTEMARSDDEQENVNRKATIVMEHLIQASDVAHTMQHWHIYRKWYAITEGKVSHFARK